MGCLGGSIGSQELLFLLVLGQHLPVILRTPSAADVDVDVHLLPFIVFSWLSWWSVAIVLLLVRLHINTLPNANIFTGIPVMQSVFGVHCAEGARHNLRLFHDALKNSLHESLDIGETIRKFILQRFWWIL